MADRDTPYVSPLYPMLSEQPAGASDQLLADLMKAPLEKSRESNRLREQALAEHQDDYAACAQEMAQRFRSGATLFACGNGGSATAANDLAVDFVSPPPPLRALPAISLTNDVAVVTAITNDVSFDDVFSRQIIAQGRRGDIIVGVSTSGNSKNVLDAFHQGRMRDMLTIGLSGYDGGLMAKEADYCFVVRSSSVHRIQEVQATIAHVLWELVYRYIGES